MTEDRTNKPNNGIWYFVFGLCVLPAIAVWFSSTSTFQKITTSVVFATSGVGALKQIE